MSTCKDCGQPSGSCFAICPSNDPFQGNHKAESEDYEAYAAYDDHAERFAGEGDDSYEGDDYEDPSQADTLPAPAMVEEVVAAVVSNDEIPF